MRTNLVHLYDIVYDIAVWCIHFVLFFFLLVAGHRGGERCDESSAGGGGTQRCIPVGQESMSTLTAPT